MKSLYIILLLSILAPSWQLTPADFQIKELPGLATQPSFKHYSGFMEATPGNYIFFWFVESQSNPSTDPLIYWTNGGPGASGIAYGLFTEHGPFRVQNDSQTVEEYEYSWNKIANVLYVEQPAGVGFSYSEDSSHYTTDDKQSAEDIWHFLINFFDTFTDFQDNDFYITSESYGGHYIPTTADRILDGKTQKGGDALFNRTKGFLIGNPATAYGANSDQNDQIPQMSEFFFHGLLPVSEWNKVVAACDYAEYYTACTKDYTSPTQECQDAIQSAQQFLPDPSDFLNVLAPVCQDNGKIYGLPWNKAYDPCLGSYVAPWITSEKVLQAIHANTKPNPNWPGARDGFNYDQRTYNMTSFYPRFFEQVPNWNIEIVSGTADPDCPHTGTSRWLNCLGRENKKPTYNWKIDGNVAGQTTEHEGITFTTVKGCGHTIPTYCPEPGLEFIRNYLSRTTKEITE